jgi:PAS domain S-box-containing protein
VPSYKDYDGEGNLGLVEDLPLARALRGERTHNEERRVVRKDGTTRWELVSSAPICSVNGEILAGYLIMMDITERKQVEEALRESEGKYRSVFAAVSDSIFLMDKETGSILDVNDTACRTYGYTRQEMLQLKNVDMSAEPDRTESATREFCGRIPLRYHKKKDGTVFPVDISASIFQLHDRPVFLAAVRDITEQKKAEANLIEAQKMAGLGTLAAGIAHEINTPLQVITGLSESLGKDLQASGKLEGERHARSLSIINRNAWRVAEIVRSLQHYAYPTQGQTEETDLNSVVKDTLILMEHQLKTWSNIEIHTHLAQDLPPFFCNRNKIIQVLINLLSNARDAMPNGGAVTIETSIRPHDNRLVLKIIDNGKGMSEEMRARVFDPFYTTKPVGQGTGLGLPIVQGIVRSHGGEIKVESAKGKGTTFIITLPLTDQVKRTVNGENISLGRTSEARYDDN